MIKTLRKPDWIRYKIPGGKDYLRVKKTVDELGLHTICTEAGCPNFGECFARGTATFLILGDTCTRNCAYCAVNKGVPSPPEMDEPERVAEAVRILDLKYAVITSVTRDDLKDGGASIFAETCRQISEKNKECKIELLIPDFRNSTGQSIEIILKEEIHILNHNIETVKELFPRVRAGGDYGHSLKLLKNAVDMGAKVKSGLMIGLGETGEQITSTMQDLLDAGCRLLTVGQYLQPGQKQHEVVKYYHPDEFEQIKDSGLRMGFDRIFAGPNVRSSYLADSLY